MEGILHTFGIDGRLIVIQIFNFALLGAALWYFLYTPVLTMLSEREKKIKKGVEDAENAAQALASAENEKSSILTEANKEAESVATRATLHAKEKAALIAAEADAKAARTIADAQQKGEDLKAQARKESEDEIAKVAVLAAEKVLRQQS